MSGTPLSSPRAPLLSPWESEASRAEPLPPSFVEVLEEIASVTTDRAGSSNRVRVRAVRIDGHGFLELQAPYVSAKIDVFMLAKACRLLGVKL